MSDQALSLSAYKDARNGPIVGMDEFFDDLCLLERSKAVELYGKYSYWGFHSGCG
jgi:hypothetical protein